MILAKEQSFIETHSFDTVEKFLASISYGGALYHLLSENHIFRGHSNEANYVLIPSALRTGAFSKIGYFDIDKDKSIAKYVQLANEYGVLSSFFRRSDDEGLPLPNCDRLRNELGSLGFLSAFQNEVWLPRDLYEIAALAQHYGLPTRLLDWTKDINVALYFAISDSFNGKGCGDRLELWCLDLSAINSMDVQIPIEIIVPSYYGNPNLAAQKGVFSMWHIQKEFSSDGNNRILINDDVVDTRSFDELVEDYLSKANMLPLQNDKKKLLYHISIPSDNNKLIYEFIKKAGYDARRLFPGYYGIVRAIKEEELICPTTRENNGKRIKIVKFFE